MESLDTGTPAQHAVRTAVPAVRSRTVYWTSKRVLDVLAAALLLALLSPLLLLTALAVKLDSPGPAIYRQERVGCRRRKRGAAVVWDVRTFPFYKFRTMFCSADPSVHHRYVRAFCKGQLAAEDNGGAAFKLNGDPRITRLGRILRKASLDELPQLLNVLKGDMSLVGPRPVPVYEAAHYSGPHCKRFAAAPGITGVWQVYGRGRVPFEEMIRMDVEYTRRCSLWLDLKILLLTIPVVVCGRGAR